MIGYGQLKTSTICAIGSTSVRLSCDQTYGHSAADSFDRTPLALEAA